MNEPFADNPPTSSLTIALYVIHEIVFILFALAGICLDGLLIYTVAKYRRIQTVANVYIANWAIADIFSLIFTPSAYSILQVLSHLSDEIYTTVFHAIFSMGMVSHALVNFCVLLQLVDWAIQVFSPATISQPVQKYHRFILGALWIVAVIVMVASVTTCSALYRCYVGGTELLVSLGVIGLLVVVSQLVVCARKCRNRPVRDSTLRLQLATVYAVTWTIGFSNMIFVKWQFEHPLLSAVLDCVTFSTSFVNIALLYYYDVDFQACLIQVLRRGKYNEGIDQFNESVVVNRNVDVNNVM